jgi:hypothetical protein
MRTDTGLDTQHPDRIRVRVSVDLGHILDEMLVRPLSRIIRDLVLGIFILRWQRFRNEREEFVGGICRDESRDFTWSIEEG